MWRPTPEFIAGTNWAAFCRAAGMPDYDALHARAEQEPEWFWAAAIDFLGIRFFRPYDRILDLSQGLPHPRWCVGGTTNFVLNALDKHLPAGGERTALVWESEDGETLRYTYAELADEASRLAAGLRSLGLRKGEGVGVYLPMVPQTQLAFLAIAKLGCIALPLFSGFGAEALATRLQDAGAAAVVTVDGTLRRGQPIAMKPVLDEALASVPSVRHVIVAKRLGLDLPGRAGRDIAWKDLVSGGHPAVPTAELEADHPLMIIYTSGTTGRPKGVVHTHAGFTVKMALDTHLVWDVRADDRIAFMADFGWLAGPMATAAYLLNGASYIMAEGTPDYPEPGRLLRLIEQHRVTMLSMAPTIARGWRRHSELLADAYNLSSLRIIACSGEPIDESTWLWTHQRIGRGRCPVVNFSGGTEIGTILFSNIVKPIKPAAFNSALPSIGADVVDETGSSVGPGEVGELIMRGPCLGRIHELWRDPERYLESYWSDVPKAWSHHDLASRDADGHWFIHGRSDDTMKIAGKRTGPAELEAALIATGLVSDAAVVGVPDPIKGSAIVCVAIPRSGMLAGVALAERLSDSLVAAMGTSYRPRQVLLVTDLPRTRNLKIVRRAVRASLLGEPLGDMSALANPEAIEELRHVLDTQS